MNERLLQLRTQELDLSQKEFVNKLGITSAAISRYESGNRKLPESIILSICRIFRVNYYWLTEGQLPIFTGTPENVVDEIAEDYNLDEIDKKIIQKYLELDSEHLQILKDYLKCIFT